MEPEKGKLPSSNAAQGDKSDVPSSGSMSVAVEKIPSVSPIIKSPSNTIADIQSSSDEMSVEHEAENIPSASVII